MAKLLKMANFVALENNASWMTKVLSDRTLSELLESGQRYFKKGRPFRLAATIYSEMFSDFFDGFAISLKHNHNYYNNSQHQQQQQ